MAEKAEDVRPEGPIDIAFVGGPLDGQQRHFDKKPPEAFSEDNASYHWDPYTHDFRFDSDPVEQPPEPKPAQRNTPIP